MSKPAPSPDDEIIDLVATTTLDPRRYARVAYDWGHGELVGVHGPRTWQDDVLGDIARHLAGPNRFQPLMLAVASGHGIGKSALMGIITSWALSTCEDCKIVITANTEGQLRTKTSPEISTWMRRSITAGWFDIQATSIKSKDTKHADTWRADFVPWSENNTEAFAGLHNKGKRIVLLMDEGSAIADKVWEVAEGALTDEDTEIIWIVFGNPTRATGRFRECFRRWRHRWITRNIDSRTVDGTNKEQIAKWAQDYGEDSDWFKIRVRGLFPSASPKQFISQDLVDRAVSTHLRPDQYEFAPKILGVDPAWEGDDTLEIYMRQGLYTKHILSMPKNDNDVWVASKIAQLETELGIDAVFVDGGYGTGIVSAGAVMGRNWQLVWFGEKPNKPGYLNKRAEIWGEMREGFKLGMAIDPKDDILQTDLTGVETVARLDGKIQLEAKKDMKERGVPSPNRADALALTFSQPVVKRDPSVDRNIGLVQVDYDPTS